MSLMHDLCALVPRLSDADLQRYCLFHEKYAPHLATIDRDLYQRLDAEDRRRFVLWFLKRWGKIDLVNPVERALYAQTIAHAKAEDRPEEALDGRPYRVRDFRSQGHDFRLLGYDWVLGVHDVLYAQYEHADVGPRPGDVIIDGGAFIGDTAVYFHHRLAGQCHVHSFELLDENLALLVHNLERNRVPDDRVTLNKFALAERSGQEIRVEGNRAQSAASILRSTGRGEVVQTIALDDYVQRLGLERVDFIKLDIEGAEAAALRGARHTIAHFRPRLAICLYHLWDDVATLPALVHATGVDYAFSFKWVQLTDGWEAVLLAIPADQATAPRRMPPPRTDGDAVLAEAFNALARAQVRQAARRDAQRVVAPNPPVLAVPAGA